MSGAGGGRRAVGRCSAVQVFGKPFQDEQQEAISAHAAREVTAEYSDDFESDEDGILNGIGEELNESNSGAESTKKSVAVESPLSDDDPSEDAADLENEAADDLTLSFQEKKLQQILLLESENTGDDRKDGEEECLESQNEGNDGKNNEECSAAEEIPCANSQSDDCNDLPVHELQKKRNQEENKPIPKPRVHKTRNSSASETGFCRDLQPCALTGFISPNVSQELYFSQSVWGPCLESTSQSFSITFTSHKERSGDSDLLMCGEVPPVKDQDQKMSTSDWKLEDSSRKSPFVTEGMMTVYEETRKLEKSTDEMVKTLEGQIVTDTIQDVSVNDGSEQEQAKNTSKDTVEKLSETKERVLQNPKASLSDRSLSPVHLKKKGKSTPVSSQYLGTLKVLEDKHMQKNSAEFDKADSLRAAVFQNWLEKKRAFLLELKRIEKKKAEHLRADTEKKEAVKREEAIASFEAWKKKKLREAKKLSEKKKLEELKKREAAEQSEEKTEAAQKAFEKWKERKVEYLREKSRKEKQSERIRKKEEEELLAGKKRDSMSAVEKWNEKKEDYMKQKKVEKILERRKQEIQQAKKEEKNKKAMEEYERWLEKKERREQLEKKQKKLQPVHGDEVPSPWSPPGKVTYSRNY